MNKKNTLINLGCRLNIYEGEIIKNHLNNNNLKDVTVINSCAVTSEAEKKVAYEIRKAKRDNPDNKIVCPSLELWADSSIFDVAMPSGNLSFLSIINVFLSGIVNHSHCIFEKCIQKYNDILLIVRMILYHNLERMIRLF